MDKIFALCRELGASFSVRYSPEHDSWYIRVERMYFGHQYSYGFGVPRNQLEQSKADYLEKILDDIREKLSNERLCGVVLRRIDLVDYGME